MFGISLLWAKSFIRREKTNLIGSVAGIAVAVAMLATLAGFFAATESSMTRQAIADVPVDWQVQLQPGADFNTAIAELEKNPGSSNLVQVGYFTTPGFQATTGNTTQTTGTGKVIGLGDGYRTAFPAEIRDLVGQGSVLLAQQTAANLHAAPGTIISIQRPGMDPAQLKVDAVVDLPQADSFFQVVGAAPGAAPQAPPDNVLIIPLQQWHDLFDPVSAIAPQSSWIELHATIPHHFSASPASAFTDVSGMARNYESRLAGAGIVGNNLAARLDVARADALYARVLFLFLGLPGAMLAAAMTAVLIASTAVKRRRDQALLRLRGATTRQLVQLASTEALIVGGAGSVLGLALAAIAVRATFGRWGFGIGTSSSILWGVVAALIGLALAVAMIVIPAWRNARSMMVREAKQSLSVDHAPLWERFYLDILLLAIAAVVYWQAGQHGYQIVLAPEGTPKVSVSYTSFLAPLFLWAGAALLTLRITRLLLGRGKRVTTAIVSPIGHALSPLIGSLLSRQRSRVAIGVALVLVSIAFAVSTSTFNATYEAQAKVDAELTNGADVTVTGGPQANLVNQLGTIAAMDGVAAAQPMQHRFAYVGADLQDLYGIGPANIEQATKLSDSFFVGSSAKEVLSRLASTPDGVLVSPETVSDFQLQPGDMIKLRLQSAADQQYHIVVFHYVGIAREFPTAPSDSFLVANSAYIAAQTGNSTVETILVKTSGSPATVAASIRDALGPTSGATVRDITEAQRAIHSGLTAVSLHGLTRIELIFAIGLAGAGAGLILVLGLEERRRSLAIVSALGAKRQQVGAFVWSEAGIILSGGIAGGLLLGWLIAYMLIKLLTQLFDPPPSQSTIPWLYIVLVLVVASGAVLLAAKASIRISQRGVLAMIRRL